jgi:hypothetical protein
MSCVAHGLPYSIVQTSKMDYVRSTMGNYKEKAIGILLILGSILVLMATWNAPEGGLPEMK